jgi:hypothetical protein
VVSALEYVTGTKSCCANGEPSPVQSYLKRSLSSIIGSQSQDGTIEQATLSREVNIKSHIVIPFPLASSLSTTSSIGEKSHSIMKAKAERRIRVSYGEMLN